MNANVIPLRNMGAEPLSLLDVPALPGQMAGRVRKLVLRDGRHQGMEVIEVDNGRLRFWLLPERGMGIWKVWAGDVEIGWRSPVRGPISPAFVPVYDPSGLGWLEGFDELLCRCGLESNGAPEFDDQGRLRYPLHGKIANLPAHDVDVSLSEERLIRVAGRVDETRYHFQKLQLHSVTATELGSNGLCIADRVINRSSMPGEFQLLYHINFGAPMLDPGSTVIAPVKTLVPRTAEAASAVDTWDRIASPAAGFQEQVYFLELLADTEGMSRVMLRNAAGNRGVCLRFNARQLPCFTLWKSTASLEDGYVVGLEPGTNFPNPRSYEGAQGRVRPLAGGAEASFEVHLDVLSSEAEVQAEASAIAALQAQAVPAIHRAPLAGWSIEART